MKPHSVRKHPQSLVKRADGGVRLANADEPEGKVRHAQDQLAPSLSVVPPRPVLQTKKRPKQLFGFLDQCRQQFITTLVRGWSWFAGRLKQSIGPSARQP
jgi:hypothetical protein